MPEELDETWDAVRTALRASSRLTDFSFHIWLEPLRLAGRQGDTLFVAAPEHIRSWVGERYLGVLNEAASRALGTAVGVEVVGADWSPPEPDPASPAMAGDDAPALNPGYTFDQFVISEGNRFAHAAALAVAEMPSQAYNPLFVYGRPGVGKTHLLHAVGNYVNRFGGGLTVRYATAESFTNEFVSALQHGGAEGFKARFRRADVLLVDDVQFLENKVRTEDEFFHTFNALHECGSQLVITSDRRPADIAKLGERLRERFEWGLVVDLEPPDLAGRMTILRNRARHDLGGAVDQETLAVIARYVTSNVRTLEGALIRVVAWASLQGQRPSPELAETVLSRLHPRPSGRPASIDQIQDAAASAFGVTRQALLAYDRRSTVALARQIAMYLARELTGEPLPAIGASFGGRNHSTVVHAHQKIAREVERGGDAADSVRLLTDLLREGRT